MRTIVEIANGVEKEMEGRSLHMLAVRVASVTHDELLHEFYRKINTYREKLIAAHEQAEKWCTEAAKRQHEFGFGMWEETEEEQRRRFHQEQEYQRACDRVTDINHQWGAVVDAFGKSTVDAAWQWKQEQDGKPVS